MESILKAKEISFAEKTLMENLKIPSSILMENAGAKSAEMICSIALKHNCDNILILLGKGNNAGDGMVISRHILSKNFKPINFFLYPSTNFKNDAKTNYDILKNITLDEDEYFLNYKDFNSFRNIFDNLNKGKLLVIDAVFGIGFRGEPEDYIKNIFNYINSNCNGIVVAIDVPSGLSDTVGEDDVILRADYTLTMGVKKLNTVSGLGREYCGHVEKINLSIDEKYFGNPSGLYMVEGSDIKEMMPKPRKVNSNKYSSGKVFILAGSKGFSGAGYLSSMAALRSGAGAVIIGFPESLDLIYETKLTEVIKKPLPENSDFGISKDAYENINELVQWSDVTLIGPGLGRSEETLEVVRRIVKNNSKPFVIDADGLFAFKNNLIPLKNQMQIILTPHYGEFSNLTGIETNEIKNNFINLAKDFASKNNVTLVLKNSPTIITQGEKIYINSTGGENLATVGTGDVLAGIISGIFSQYKDFLKSSIVGNYIHGLCGDILKEKKIGNSTLAGDLLNIIPEAIYKIQNLI